MKIKYVIYDEVFPYIFGEYSAHDHVRVRSKGEVTSAGFVSFREEDRPADSPFCQTRIIKAHCYGESISLGVKSRGEDDAHLIDRMMNS